MLVAQPSNSESKVNTKGMRKHPLGSFALIVVL
jgi:hypothetical protein